MKRPRPSPYEVTRNGGLNMSLDLLSLRTPAQISLNSDDKLQTLWREAGRSRDLGKLDANEASDATAKFTWITP